MSQKTKATKKKQESAKPMESSGVDRLRWLMVVILLVLGVAANTEYQAMPGAVRLAIGILYFIFVLWVASTTITGRKARSFVKSARTEVRKVVWPTRQETLQTSLIVVLMVLAASIILWGFDALFLWLVSILTGQKG